MDEGEPEVGPFPVGYFAVVSIPLESGRRLSLLSPMSMRIAARFCGTLARFWRTEIWRTEVMVPRTNDDDAAEDDDADPVLQMIDPWVFTVDVLV